MSLTKIDRYEVMYSSNQFVPRIWLKNSGNFIGQLIFEPDGTVLPPDNQTGGQVNLYYHLEDLDSVLDILRNEKNASLLFSGTGPGNENGILTGEERLGEAIRKAA
jgi:hypothetical protein